jgi:hypothetical protein
MTHYRSVNSNTFHCPASNHGEEKCCRMWGSKSNLTGNNTIKLSDWVRWHLVHKNTFGLVTLDVAGAVRIGLSNTLNYQHKMTVRCDDASHNQRERVPALFCNLCWEQIPTTSKHIIEELADSNFNCHAVIIGIYSDCSQGLEADIADLWVLLLWWTNEYQVSWNASNLLDDSHKGNTSPSSPWLTLRRKSHDHS